MPEINQGFYSGERALFKAEGLLIKNTVFNDGESPLKESNQIELCNTIFRWKYPLWYSDDITMDNCMLLDTARAGIWYTDNVRASKCVIEAPKAFRRCQSLILNDVRFANAEETLWNCNDVTLKNVYAKGDYFAMNSKGVNAYGLEIVGNYPFDNAENVTVENARLLSKDAFWNSKNVTVRNSFISGEYLGWNSENLTFENCIIESLQGMCYIKNLTLINCTLINTTLAFEYSTVCAQINGKIDSIKNPSGGTIRADDIGELIMTEKSTAKIITGDKL